MTMMTMLWTRTMGRQARGLVAGATIAALLAGCGGSGAGGQGGSTIDPSGGTSDGASLQLITDQAQLLSDGSTSATITAIVKDKNNNVLAGQPVQMSTEDGNTSLTPGATPKVTNAAGRISSTLDLLASTNEAKANRVVVVTATSGTLTRTIQVPVVGTTVAIDPPAANLSSGVPAEFTVTLKDGGGKPISGAPVTLTSAAGSTITPAQATTVDGIAKFNVVGSSQGGEDRLTAAALGATGTASLTVASGAAQTGLRFSASALDVAVNQNSTPIGVTYLVDSVPRANETLTLALTRGQFTGCACTSMDVVTDASGNANVQVQSPTVGVASLTALVKGTPATASTMAVRFFSGPINAAKVSVSSSASSVGVNPGTPANNKSVITAIVRDATDNPVQGAVVLFSAVADASGGTLSPATAVTDATGAAASTFTPGAVPSGPNGVELRAALASNAATGASTRLTVDQVALFVDLGTGNQISALNTTTYQMPWTAQVTDSSQKAVAGQAVAASLTSAYAGDNTNPDLKYYYKGVWVWTGDVWGRVAYNAYPTPPGGTMVECLNEDINRNNILDPGEDKNGNGKLDPGSPASVQVSGVTDGFGMVPVTLTYSKSFGGWVNVSLKATIDTSGTQSSAQRTFILPLLSSDINSADKIPPSVGATINWGSSTFLKGPYGADPARDADGFCTSPN